MTLMEEIERARRRIGVTRTALADRAGRSLSTYSRAADGKIRPSARTLKDFAVALELIAAEQAEQAARLARLGNHQERTAA